MNAAALQMLADKGFTSQEMADFAGLLETDQTRSKAAARQACYRQRGGGKIPEDMRQEVFERDGFACAECGSEDYLQCDHVHPVSKGGETSLENLQTLCRVCNARKKDRIRKRNSTGNSGGSSSETPRNSPPIERNHTPRSVADATGAEAPDPVKELFDVGVSMLKSQGHSEAKARSLIGSWRKGRSPGEVVAALVDAKTRSISNLVEWMPKRLGGGQRDMADIVLEEAERRKVA